MVLLVALVVALPGILFPQKKFVVVGSATLLLAIIVFVNHVGIQGFGRHVIGPMSDASDSELHVSDVAGALSSYIIRWCLRSTAASLLLFCILVRVATFERSPKTPGSPG